MPNKSHQEIPDIHSNEYTYMIEATLDEFLKYKTPNESIYKLYRYGVLPAGKLFRPKIALAFYNDLTNKNPKDIMSFAIALELHHAYSLVHDDLPAMDNDLLRRNQPSFHAAYGEWKAILIGDGLLNLSYEALTSLKHPHALTLIKLFSRYLGPRGLIHGQYMDLSEEMNLSLPHLLKTHELKTGRLIQLAFLGPYILSCDQENQRIQYREFKKFYRMGKSLGILFQLIDDLLELTQFTEHTMPAHEILVNPFLRNPNECIDYFIKELKMLEELPQKYCMTWKFLEVYFKKSFSAIEDNAHQLQNHFSKLSGVNFQGLIHSGRNFLSKGQ